MAGWTELANTKIRTVADTTYAGVTYVVSAWNSAVIDTQRNRMLIWGGGHNDYFGNEVYSLNLNAVPPTMTRLTNSSTGGCSQESCDGGVTPNSRHTYDLLFYVPGVDKMCSRGGALAANGNGSNGLWSFDCATNIWTQETQNGAQQPATSTNNGAAAYDSVTQKVFLSDRADFFSFTYATKTWVRVGSAVGSVGYHQNCIIDPTRRKFITLGGGDSGIFDISGGGSYNRADFVTTGGAAVTAANYPGLTYDPVSDRILAWIGGDTVYSLNVDTATWTAITAYTGSPGAAQGNGTYKRFSYSVPLNACVLVNNVDQNAYTFALSDPTPDTENPTDPTSLVATAFDSQQIDLTWTASTDNVGVAGYRVERCQGAACSGFIQVAAPLTNSYSDTGLTFSTLYRYRVRAVDAGGNFSGYSNIAEDTTDVTPTVQIGPLVHDGAATPEQLSLFISITGTLTQAATATVRYKQSSSGAWIVGHAMYRIQPTLALTPSVGTVQDAFAWPIIGLSASTSYDVEVTVYDGVTTEVRTATFVTRSFPATAGAPNKTITAGSSTATIQAVFDGAVPGDVIQFQDGTYTIDALQLNASGTSGNPIYIRGESRSGVVLHDSTGRILYVLDASHIVWENMTMQGNGTDSGTAASSQGIIFYDGAPTQTRFTIRNVTMTGVDVAIQALHEISECLIYDNTLTGNNVWTEAYVNTNLTWNDTGINVPGYGNSVFQNTITGFGDSLACEIGGLATQSHGVHFYRNDIRNSDDDSFEADGAHRNITYYDNRIHNAMSFLSLDPLFGGPLLACRNIAINIGRTPFKWNSTNAGQFIYNNTVIRTSGKAEFDLPGSSAEAGWYQPNDGPQRAFGYRNNILVYQGASSQIIRLDNSGYDPVDWTHNSWYPDGVFQWPQGRFDTLAQAYSGLLATAPVFTGFTKRQEQDNITTMNPWVLAVTLAASYLTEVVATYTPTLANGTVPKNSGVAIANVTDGFSGVLPDRGAIISGRTAPAYGDQTGVNPPSPVPRLAIAIRG